jgi:hypothetical protein
MNNSIHDRGLERKRAREQPVENNASRENVSPDIQRRTLELLRRHVMQAADDFRAADTGIADPRDAEIHNLHAVILQHHYIGGLDVAMDDAAIVRIVQAIADGNADAEFVGPGSGSAQKK